MLITNKHVKNTLQFMSNGKIQCRSLKYEPYFSNDGAFTYCKDIVRLVECLCSNYCSDEWCLFIDASSYSLKTVLMAKDFKFPCVPIAYGHVKEDCLSIETILSFIGYENHQWTVMCDLSAQYAYGCKEWLC